MAPPPTVRPPAERAAAAPAARPPAPPPAAPPAARAAVPAEREVARPRDAEPVRAPAPEPAEGAQAPAQSAPAAAPPPSPRRRSGRALPRVPGWERVSTDAPPRDTARPVDTARRPDSERPGDVARPAESARPTNARRAGGREPTASDLRELVIEADSVIGLQVDSFVTTRTAEVEDDVHARITRDVLVGGEVAIPAGTAVRGSVTLVERAGRVKGRSRLGVRFHTVVLDDGVEMPMVTETVFREAGSGGSERAASIGSPPPGGPGGSRRPSPTGRR